MTMITVIMESLNNFFILKLVKFHAKWPLKSAI